MQIKFKIIGDNLLENDQIIANRHNWHSRRAISPQERRYQHLAMIAFRHSIDTLNERFSIGRDNLPNDAVVQVPNIMDSLQLDKTTTKYLAELSTTWQYITAFDAKRYHAFETLWYMGLAHRALRSESPQIWFRRI